MANEIRFQVFGDVKDFEKKLSKLNKSFDKLIKVGSGGLLASGGAIFGLIKAAEAQAKAVAKVNQAIISTGNAAGFSLRQLEKEAQNLQKNTLFGDEVILQNATAQLLTFTNIAQDNFLRTQRVALDVATVLDTTGDGTSRLKDVSIQLGKALNDPVANLGALSRAGIQFSEEQKIMIKGLAETNQLAEAQNIILDELERQYGGQAKAAVTTFGALTQLRNRIGDVFEEIGKHLTPALSILTTKMGEWVTLLENNPQLGIYAAKAIALTAAVSGLAIAFGVAGKVVVVATSIMIGAFRAFGLLLAVLTSPVTGILLGLGLAIVALHKVWEKNLFGMGHLLDGFFAKLYELKDKVAKVFNAVKDSVVGAVNKVKGVFGSIGVTTNTDTKTISGSNTDTNVSNGDQRVASEQEYADRLLEIETNLLAQKREANLQYEEFETQTTDEKRTAKLLARQQELEGYLLELESKRGILLDHNEQTIQLEQELSDELNKIETARSENAIAILKKQLKVKELFQAKEVESIQNTLNQVSTLGKTAARVVQSIEIGLATIRIAGGIARAFSDYPFPASLGVAAIIAAQGAVQIATIARQSFAEGTTYVPNDQVANIHKGEMIVPQRFAEGIRRGDLALSGGENRTGPSSSVIFDFSNSEFNGINETTVKDMFRKASEMIANKTLIFKGV